MHFENLHQAVDPTRIVPLATEEKKETKKVSNEQGCKRGAALGSQSILTLLKQKALDLQSNFHYFQGKSLELDGNQETSDFNKQSLTSIPFGGLNICTNQKRSVRQKPQRCTWGMGHAAAGPGAGPGAAPGAPPAQDLLDSSQQANAPI